jgi:hypothetical protein
LVGSGAVNVLRQLDEAALQVPHVGLGEVLVLAHDDDGALPEVLGLALVVAEQPP